MTHLEVFKECFKEHWFKEQGEKFKNTYSQEQLEERFTEEWDEMMADEKQKEEILGVIFSCMDKFHYELSEKGDSEKQVYQLGSELVTIFLEREQLKKQVEEQKGEIQHLEAEVQMLTQRKNTKGLRLGSYQYRSKKGR